MSGVIVVTEYSPDWAVQFAATKRGLETALKDVDVLAVEHVGSTAVPGLAAKPVLDIDVIVERAHVDEAVAALQRVGYAHLGDLGFTDREALAAPDESPRRHVYVCVNGTLHVRNHLAVREVLCARTDLRDAYASVKQMLATDPTLTMDQYLAGKTKILQRFLAAADLMAQERAAIQQLNAPEGSGTPRPESTG